MIRHAPSQSEVASEVQTASPDTTPTPLEAALHPAPELNEPVASDATTSGAPASDAPSIWTLRDVARYVPHVARLVGRCLGDKRVPLWRKSSLAGLALYLAMPFDLVPDFLPIVGQADDLLLIVWVLRGFVRAVPPAVLEEHWDGDITLPQLMENMSRVLHSLFKRRTNKVSSIESNQAKPDETP
jgi:uncharacterized membrane protein YkvA (DUF1232 family)